MSRYQICFDLLTDKETEKILKEKYNKSLSSLYDLLKKHFKKNNFLWVQGSVYYSNNNITDKKVEEIIENFFDKNLWMAQFTRDIKITLIEDMSYNYNKMLTIFKERYIEQEKNKKQNNYTDVDIKNIKLRTQTENITDQETERDNESNPPKL